MNLEDIQPWVLSLIKAEPELANVPTIADDGSYPKTPGREAALKSRGLVLIIWAIESDGLVDDSPKGGGVEEISIVIVIEENITVSRSAAGIGIPVEKALRLVRRACLGKQPALAHGVFLRASITPFKHFGTQSGLARILAMFNLRVPL